MQWHVANIWQFRNRHVLYNPIVSFTICLTFVILFVLLNHNFSTCKLSKLGGSNIYLTFGRTELAYT